MEEEGFVCHRELKTWRCPGDKGVEVALTKGFATLAFHLPSPWTLRARSPKRMAHFSLVCEHYYSFGSSF